MNLNLLVEKFFNENDYNRIADKLVVMRHDGINVYSNCEDQFEASSIGALVAGLWQAAESLSSLLKKNDEFFEFRLGFDTSSEGLYVLPFTIMKSTYYVCAIYSESNNPAKLKRNLRLLKDSLEVFLSEFSLDEEANRKGYLFNEISDSEMDNLFSFGGV
ncbi:MAG: hypothetical protein ACJAS4_001537 [Bacteriovoracaceae bacterium]